MIRIALLGLAIAIAGVSGVSAQTFFGAGTISCGEWLRLRSSEQNRGNAQLLSGSYQAQAWIDGFLSGYNLASPSDPDFLASKVGGVALYTWLLDNYCRSNPLDSLTQAALAVVKELQSRAKRK